MKNIFISSLLVYLLSTKPGWAVSGTDKFLLCVLIVLLMSACLFIIDDILNDFKRYLRKDRRNYRKAIRNKRTYVNK